VPSEDRRASMRTIVLALGPMVVKPSCLPVGYGFDSEPTIGALDGPGDLPTVLANRPAAAR
jgi:hypothetical protein